MAQIKNMSRQERLEVLKELLLSTPDILDYLIEIHTRALSAPPVGISGKTIAVWQNVLECLISARGMFGG